MGEVAFWPIASFCDNGALRSLSERSGHQLVGKTWRYRSRLTHFDVEVMGFGALR